MIGKLVTTRKEKVDLIGKGTSLEREDQLTYKATSSVYGIEKRAD